MQVCDRHAASHMQSTSPLTAVDVSAKRFSRIGVWWRACWFRVGKLGALAMSRTSAWAVSVPAVLFERQRVAHVFNFLNRRRRWFGDALELTSVHGRQRALPCVGTRRIGDVSAYCAESTSAKVPAFSRSPSSWHGPRRFPKLCCFCCCLPSLPLFVQFRFKARDSALR